MNGSIESKEARGGGANVNSSIHEVTYEYESSRCHDFSSENQSNSPDRHKFEQVRLMKRGSNYKVSENEMQKDRDSSAKNDLIMLDND